MSAACTVSSRSMAKAGREIRTASGAYLRNHGLNLCLTGDYDSTSVLLERVD